ncbi:excinuclease ABC, C subunit [Candidatus Endolissoclinum faulkneri L2]|uniref:UvrABC system protein C n=1 Tax=Candidatus Endolissoclinum faulkneri L2 TaxID=1193729 RepID=K7Z494_9PROT|nr:excinuclease ABC subunit UvrC [Candidatus Endolissoclinum faulkneri]AFX98838.1 excinuclease ABC, C subunit [Candidatus Endolissoclinum faulkneri L2]
MNRLLKNNKYSRFCLQNKHTRDSGTRVADIKRGVDVIKAQVHTLPNAPGVYRMLDADGNVLYVGKACNLKKRVMYYTKPAKLEYRIFCMVSETASMEIIRTHTDIEALLLENNIIKHLQPRFNILLRDDKSFPYILLTKNHQYPHIMKHRGIQRIKGYYFGPFASASSVTSTITALQRAFLLRNCNDTMFSNRQRPCIQYQIKRCSAPCVGYVNEEQYAKQVEDVKRFLTGQSNQIQQEFANKMQKAAEALDFETAAIYRNRIRAMTIIQADQQINLKESENADVIAMYGENGLTCIQVFFFRSGNNFGNRAYFLDHDKQARSEDLLAAFIGQFYDNKVPPQLVLTSHNVSGSELIAEDLSRRAKRKVELLHPQRSKRRKLIDYALTNAHQAFARRIVESENQCKLLEGVAIAFGINTTLKRIEVYDNSHIQGCNAVGAMIVAGPNGLIKNAYRKFNISNISKKKATEDEGNYKVPAGDDYAMLRQVLTRRFSQVAKENQGCISEGWPDLILIDGGQGQLNVACEVLHKLMINNIAVVALAKGQDRNAGRERFFLPGRKPFIMKASEPVLHFLQRLRDEAHRFAIANHRVQRIKRINTNRLDEIMGIGKNRKKALIHHFGSVRDVHRASFNDLKAVKGISATLAKKVYSYFHNDE